MKPNPCDSCQRTCHHRFIDCVIWQEWAYSENIEKEDKEDESMGDSEDSNDAINI